MKEELIIKGKWSIPNSPAGEVMGEVKFTPNEGVELTLMGEFGIRYRTIEFVNGISNKGKEMTIYKLVRTQIEFSPSLGFAVTKYRGTVLLINRVFQSNKELKVRRIESSVTSLQEWLNHKSFEIQRSDDRRKISVDYELSADLRVRLPKKQTLKIKNTYDLGETNQRQSFHINETSYVSFEYRRDTKLENAIWDLGVFKNFITILSDTTSVHNWIRIFCKGEPTPIEVYYKTAKVKNHNPNKENHQMLLPYSLIKDDFSEIITNWYESYQNLRRVYNEYFAVKYYPSTFISDSLLSLCRAVEAFHRETTGTERTYFRVRVNEVLINYCKGFLVLAKVYDREKFSSALVQLRNDATHANAIDDIGNKRASKEYTYFNKVELFLTVAILIHVGVDAKLVRKRIEGRRFI